NGNLIGTDAEGSPLTYSAGSIAAAHGLVSINPSNGLFTYTPNANYNGPDSFSYKVNDGTFNSLEALVSITVVPQNDLPIAIPSSVTTAEDTQVGGLLTATDGDGNTLTFSIGSITPAHGTVSVTSNGVFIYTPAANFHGSDSFTFKANDGTSDSAEATVTITVTSVNDAPVAFPTSIPVTKNTVFNGILVATDADNDPLSYSQGSVVAAHGTVVILLNGTYTYTPFSNYTGPDAFTFKANDGTVNSNEALVTVTVSAPNNAPTVVNGVGSVNENAVLNGSIASLGTDLDGNSLSYSVVATSVHGVLVLNANGTFTYTPATNYTGPDSFTFRANDGQAFSNVGTVSLTVVPTNVPLTLTLPSSSPQVSRNSTKVHIDPAATLVDPDTIINYAGAKITVGIANLSSADAVNGRVTLAVLNQGSGTGLVKVKGSKVYFNGSTSSIGTISGGTKGSALVITFNSGASELAVNAVLRQITIQASKKATTGNLTLNYQAVAGGQTALGTKIATIL
ncbi:MAG: outer rane adhesin like protein, partial [Planctomycetaceae bacterium]|nr:outer rane adhesin like protein [Planctomycetaceae bacterium]